MRLFAGQADAADPSHFTIVFDDDGQTRTIDGWLQSDDTILLEPRASVGRNDQP